MTTAQQGELCAAEEIYDVMSQEFKGFPFLNTFLDPAPSGIWGKAPSDLSNGGIVISHNGE